MARCAAGNQTYCTKDIQYPIEIIEKLLRKNLHKFADVFGEDMISSEITNRNNPIDEITLCDSYEEVIYPTSGKNRQNQELYIFNTDNHKQGVRISRCRDRGVPCRMSNAFPNGYHTECKQHYVYRELLSVSPEGVAQKDKFEFPACCSCAVYRSEDKK